MSTPQITYLLIDHSNVTEGEINELDEVLNVNCKCSPVTCQDVNFCHSSNHHEILFIVKNGELKKLSERFSWSIPFDANWNHIMCIECDNNQALQKIVDVISQKCNFNKDDMKESRMIDTTLLLKFWGNLTPSNKLKN